MALNPVILPITDVPIVSLWATRNPCWTKPTKRDKKALMLHSTATPGAAARNFYAGQNKETAGTAVEFWLDDKEVLQMFPVGPNKGCVTTWHCGSGSKGSYNTTHAACEMCEPVQTQLIPINFQTQGKGVQYPKTYSIQRIQMELRARGFYKGDVTGKFDDATTAATKAFQASAGMTQDGMVTRRVLAKLAERDGSFCDYDVEGATPFFNAAYNNAVKLFAFLCSYLGAKPSEIVCHSEAALQGYASSHADVMHWFPYHRKSMDHFRDDVQAQLNGAWTPLGAQKVDIALSEAVDTLVANGVINTPDLWKQFAPGSITTNHVYALLRQAAVKTAELSFRYCLKAVQNLNSNFEPDYWLNAEVYDKEHGDFLYDLYRHTVTEPAPIKEAEDSHICMDDGRFMIREIGKHLANLSYIYAVDILEGPAGINSPNYWKSGKYQDANVRFLVLALATVFGDPDRRETK